jgi:hypothetical protein
VLSVFDYGFPISKGPSAVMLYDGAPLHCGILSRH